MLTVKTMHRRIMAAATITGIIVAAVVLAQVTGVFKRAFPLPSTASLKAIKVGVFWDANATSPITAIAWGVIEPGDMVNKTVYIQNQANVQTFFTLTTNNWQPENASDFIALNWNYTGDLVPVNGIIRVELTLSVALTIVDIENFSFDIIITAVG